MDVEFDVADLKIPISIRVGLIDAFEIGSITVGELQNSTRDALASLLEQAAAVMRDS